ncbi:hypothetical protein BH012_09995 [Salmonella enterica]|nr:hypothetical protein [Salmonella enterica]EAX6601653.1 hypothetical protein [Salmonella enterica]
MLNFRFIHLPAFTHKTLFSAGNLLLDDSENRLSGDDIQKLLRRHTTGDWGDVPRSLCQINRYALEYSNSVIFCYFPPYSGIRMVTVKTCADRSQTLISVHV